MLNQFKDRKKSTFRDTDIISIWSHDGKQKYTPEITTYKALRDEILAGASGPAPGVGSVLYTETTITAAEQIAGGNFIIAPAPGPNKYLIPDTIEVIVKFNGVAMDYKWPFKTNELFTVGIGRFGQNINPDFLNSAYDNATVINFNDMNITTYSLDADITVEEYNEWIINEPLYFIIPALSSPDVGNSELLFKVTYKERNLGTEL